MEEIQAITKLDLKWIPVKPPNCLKVAEISYINNLPCKAFFSAWLRSSPGWITELDPANMAAT